MYQIYTERGAGQNIDPSNAPLSSFKKPKNRLTETGKINMLFMLI